MAPLLFKVGVAAAAPPAAPDDARGAFAVFCPGACAEVDLPGFKQRSRLPRLALAPVYSTETWGPEFGVPDAETLSVWGVGDVSGITATEEVLVIRFAGPSDGAAERVAQVGTAAAAAGAWVMDLDSGRTYGNAAFTQAIERVGAQPADVVALIVIDGAEEEAGGAIRLQTRGMAKFGLPDLLMEGVSPEREGAMGIALNGVAQTLAEGRVGQVPSRVRVDAGRLRAASAVAGLCDVNGDASLSYASPRKSDARNVHASVRFEGEVGDCNEAPGPPAPAASAPAPSPDPSAAADPLSRARAAAAAALDVEVRARFAAGEPGQLMVKAPFATAAGGTEWLWMTVETWDESGRMRGKMANDPGDVPGLLRGAVVETQQAHVFDYLWTWPDGRREGNKTAAYLR